MSNRKDSLGDRMKCYEAVPKNFLMKRTPVVIRLDGAHFHTFTKGFTKPFDDLLMEAMQRTMRYLCENIQGCVLGYTQSDEITLVLCDYQTLETSGWFNYNVQKMVSTSAAMASVKFGDALRDIAHDLWQAGDWNNFDCGDVIDMLYDKADKLPTFDARCFSLSKEEVNNCLVWRQQDAIRNSIQAVAQAHFSQKELNGINCKMALEKLLSEKNVDWNKLSTQCRRGSCCVRVDGKWVIDTEIPIFSKAPEYVNSRIVFD